MDRLDVTYINPIDDRDLSIILDCEITDSDGNSVPLNDVSVIISVYDTTDNFIMQKMVKGTEFNYNYNSEEELLYYIYDSILDIDGNENLNAGVYRLRFSFILDTFDSINNEDNKFIVTEISPDGTEIRLNPLSNDESFINTFNRIKNYKRTDKTIDLSNTGFVRFYREYVNSVFSNESISNIFSDLDVKVLGSPLSEYLASVYYERSDITNESEREADSIEKAVASINKMKVELSSKKGDALIFISKYYESIKSDLFQQIRNTPVGDDTKLNSVLNSFKMGIKNKMEEFLNDSINEVVDSVLKN